LAPGVDIGEKFKRQFGAVFTNPKDMEWQDGEGRRRQPPKMWAQLLFLALFGGGHKLLTCLASLRAGFCLPSVMHWQKILGNQFWN